MSELTDNILNGNYTNIDEEGKFLELKKIPNLTHLKVFKKLLKGTKKNQEYDLNITSEKIGIIDSELVIPVGDPENIIKDDKLSLTEKIEIIYATYEKFQKANAYLILDNKTTVQFYTIENTINILN